MRRFGVGVALAMVIGASLSLVAMGGAYAVTRPACKKVSGTITTKFTISSCIPANAQYVSASATIAALAKGTGTMTWSPSKKTTTIKTTFTTKSPGACGAGNTEYDITGSVTGGTATYTHKLDPVKGRVCVKKGALSLVPNTALTL